MNERYHSLDNLRAILMWLGIVLHAAMYYTADLPLVFPWRDDLRSRVADDVMALIHSFRMPAFFIIAGFLAAMLLEQRGPRGFLRHRTMRLALPFAVFWPFVWGASIAGGLLFMNRIAFGQWGFDLSAMPARMLAPLSLHMWFLWMLYFFCLGTALLAGLPRGPFTAAGRWFAQLGGAWWGFIPLTLPLVYAGMSYPLGAIVAELGFLLPWNEWLHHTMFFGFGLALWPHRGVLLPHYQQHWKRYALAGLLFGMVADVLYRRSMTLGFSFSYHAIAWLWSFAAIGLALKLLDRRRPWLAYLADSAYWVYLVHFPVVTFVAAALYQQPLPAIAKMLVGIVVTTAFCLASYELFVRHTWVSVLLNGKRHPRVDFGLPRSSWS
jgi:glucans biosynthesis protein C